MVRCGSPAQRLLDAVGDHLLVAGDGLDVDQGAGQRDRVDQHVRGQRVGHAAHHTGPAVSRRGCTSLARAVGPALRVGSTVETALSTSPAWGIGLATVTAEGRVLDTWFPAGPSAWASRPPSRRRCRRRADRPATLPGCRTVEVRTSRVRPRWPTRSDASDAYLRLHLLSHRLVGPTS